MKEAEEIEYPKQEAAQVSINCDVCGKSMNRKSLVRHIRDIHGRKNSVSSLVNDFDEREKRKAENNLSPPSSEPMPKKDGKASPLSLSIVKRGPSFTAQ